MTRNELYEILRECGYETTPIHTVDKIWGQPFDGVTEKITERDTERDTETAEQKLAWLTEILVTKSCDPGFTDYWLRLARRNLLLGLPLKTEEPDLNAVTEESLATQPLPLYICEDCNHEWDNDKWYCVACNHTQYRIPNPARNDEPNRLSCPTQP